MKTILKIGSIAVAATLAMAVAPVTARAEHESNRTGSFFLSIASEGFRAAFASYERSPAPPRCEPPRRWIPGHYEIRRDKVCIPGYWQTVEVPAEYGWVRHGCYWRYVIVKPACTKRVWVPERWEWQETRVWVPGRYETGNRYAMVY